MMYLTFSSSLALGRKLKHGSEILLTRLDHDANVSPWLLMAEDRGITVRWVDFRDEDCTLDMQDLASKLNKNTKVVAVGYASNAVGTINPVKEIVRLAHRAGALAYIDAVHYGPHGLIDAAALDCDFLACSTYKFFGPHMGVLYGKREHLQRIRPYKVRPNTNAIPNCWEWGTLNHECIAGITACVEYLADLGRRARPNVKTRRAAIEAAYAAIHEHERALLEQILAGLKKIPDHKIFAPGKGAGSQQWSTVLYGQRLAVSSHPAARTGCGAGIEGDAGTEMRGACGPLTAVGNTLLDSETFSFSSESSGATRRSAST